MKCLNCKKSELERLTKKVFYCSVCEELFNSTETGQEVLKDRQKFFDEYLQKMSKSKAKVFELADKFGVIIDDEEEDEDDFFGI